MLSQSRPKLSFYFIFFFLLNFSFVFGSLFWLSSAAKVVLGDSVFIRFFFFFFFILVN